MRQLLVLLMTGVVVAASFAASPSPVARAEIEGLLGRLEVSGCEFQRNGTWYSATEAKAHLLVKLSYLEDRGMVASAEQFIERAATQSSMTGRSYLVRCASAAPVPSSVWLSAQLQLMRSARPGKSAP
jgi:hypothetical protein